MATTLDYLFNPLAAIDDVLKIPSNVVGNIATQIEHIMPENINLGVCGLSLISTGQISCQQQQQTKDSTQYSAPTQEKSTTLWSPGTAASSPGASTSAPMTIAPSLDLSGLLSLFSSVMSKSPGAQQEQQKNPLEQFGGIGTILVIGAAAIAAIFLFTKK